jgi:predicted TPR repeat methyltransferase
MQAGVQAGTLSSKRLRRMPAEFLVHTSGDLVADRRFAYAEAAFAEGDSGPALDLYRQTLELVPHWPPAHFALAAACLAQEGDRAEAIAALEQVIALDPADRLGAAVVLARIAGAAASRAAMPDAYVAGLFDEYAPRFETHLTGALDYCAPEHLRDLLRGRSSGRRPFRTVLDLGCGTGLMARALTGKFERMDGVDLSQGMLKIAGQTGLYTRLVCGELLDFLHATRAEAHDLVLAADVFCYVPDLAPVFAQVARTLLPGGLFAFSVQTQADEVEGAPSALIGADSRVHHARAYIRSSAEAAGLDIIEAREASTRRDRGVPVPGALFLLAKS